jgi:hypothetical protein
MQMRGLALALLVATAACGGDDDGGSTPDAAVFYDSAPLPDATDPGTAWYLTSCGAEEADAGPEYDAGPPADAGPPPGFDDPCCDPDGVCPSGLECIQDGDQENGRCRPICIGDDNLQCPFGGVCASFGGQRICIPGSGKGDDCDPEICESGLICVGNGPDDATCKTICTGPDDCEEGEECTQLTGSDKKACL